MNKTRTILAKRFYWKNMSRDVENFIRSCDRCQRAKQINIQKTRAQLQSIPVPNRIFAQVGIDLMQLSPIDGYKYVLTVMDYFTKWIELIPLRNKEAATVGMELFKIFSRFGCPEIIISDRGTEFNNALSASLYQRMGVHHRVTSPYHPEANGMVEKANSTTTNRLKACINEQQDWLGLLDSLAMAYRASEHSSTRKSPYEMMTGSQMRLPIDLASNPFRSGGAVDQDEQCDPDTDCDSENVQSTRNFDEIVSAHQALRRDIHNEAAANIVHAQARQAKNYDARHRGTPLSVGDKILHYNTKASQRKGDKLAARWLGPYTIVEVHDNGNLTVQDHFGKVLATRFCSSHVKLYIDDSSNNCPIEAQSSTPSSAQVR